ncbi:MAG: redoxin domain-containing protein [Balneolaceae bacterium]
MVPETGKTVSDFTLKSSVGEDISLTELVADGKVLLLFFPLAFSDVCTEELRVIRNNMKFYDAVNTKVAAISVDSFFTLRELKKANNLNFLLLSDFNKKVSAQLDCLYDDYFGLKGVSKRGAFVINKNFKIEYAEVLENSEMLPDFKAIQKVLQK